MPFLSIGNSRPLFMRIPIGRLLRACWIKSFMIVSAVWSSYRIGRPPLGGRLSFVYVANLLRTTDRSTSTTMVNSGPHQNGPPSSRSWTGRDSRAPCREFQYARSARSVETDPVPFSLVVSRSARTMRKFRSAITRSRSGAFATMSMVAIRGGKCAGSI